MGNKYPDHTVYEKQAGILGMEFIYETASFPQCHASTIAETEDGLVASWFGGTHEKNPDVGIWVSRLSSAGWSEPAEVANGVQDSDKRYPCWNPVLYKPLNAPLMLFYKVGPTPRQWWAVMKTSTDGGKTWSPKTLLPKRFAGPIKNKPIQLEADTLLCPSSTEDDGWRVHFETYAYKADKWEKTGPINDGDKFAAIQPTILRLMDESSDDKLLALCRTRQGVISRSKSRDGGKTWSRMEAAGLPNPNAGFDAVTLNNGKHLLVYNHTVRERTGDVPCGREMLNVSVSDDGINWRAALVLENTRNAEFSYPAVIQTADGLVHVTYTWKRRRIKHVVIDFDKLDTKPIKDWKWPF